MSHSETSKTASHDHDRCIHNAITTAEQLCLQRGVQ
ncbi:MAG: Fur family transcriptional regulator, partial [Methylomonas sp.]